MLYAWVRCNVAERAADQQIFIALPMDNRLGSLKGAIMSDFKAISELAYELWEKGGRRNGTAEQNWLEAERILASRERAPVTVPSKTALTARAVDQLLATPQRPPLSAAPARARKGSTKSSPSQASVKPARKQAPTETPKVGSRDAPGG